VIRNSASDLRQLHRLAHRGDVGGIDHSLNVASYYGSGTAHSLSVLQLLIIMVPEETFDGELSQRMDVASYYGSAASTAACTPRIQSLAVFNS
jgi:hypothetical protein